MNENQMIQPEIRPPADGNIGINPALIKIRRKVGLTFVLSYPVKVPVGRAEAEPIPPRVSVRKSKKSARRQFNRG